MTKGERVEKVLGETKPKTYKGVLFDSEEAFKKIKVRAVAKGMTVGQYIQYASDLAESKGG